MEKPVLNNVSLITTVYNEEKTIERFLNSILNQTALPSEFIIVDGGSTDTTVEKIEKFINSHPELNTKLFVSQKRINIAKGRNKAIIFSFVKWLACWSY